MLVIAVFPDLKILARTILNAPLSSRVWYTHTQTTYMRVIDSSISVCPIQGVVPHILTAHDKQTASGMGRKWN